MRRRVAPVWRVRFRVTLAVPMVVADAVEFAQSRLDFWPDLRQAEILGRRIRRGLVNCSRQWGKSTVTAAKAMHHALTQPGSLTLLVSPSARQSGELLRKAEGFAAQLGFH